MLILCMPEEVQGHVEIAAQSTSGGREDQGIYEQILFTLVPDPQSRSNCLAEVGQQLPCSE